MRSLICFLAILACVSSASVKREEFNSDPLLALTNQVNNANRDQTSVGSSNNSPVYSPSSYSAYSNSYGSAVMPATSQSTASAGTSNYANQADTNQAYVDNVAAATSNIASSMPNAQNYATSNNQGNLYYYYYPVQDKNKETNYQASSSNQYTSSIVQPQNSEEQSNQNIANGANANNQQATNGMSNNQNHDLNYGAQDLAYTASAINENTGSSNQQGANYESQLTNLANAFNFGQGAGQFAANSQFANQLSSLGNLNGFNFGEAFGGSSIQPSSVPFVNDPAFSAMASQLGSFGPASAQSSTSSNSGSSGPLSQLYQQATQMYQGLINGATGSSSTPQFAASQQHASYEPSNAASSSFRSKYGLGSVVLPLMALAGLSLLIPTVTSLSTVASRKKRSTEDNLNMQQAGLGAYLERIDRYYSLYKNAIEREECMNRIVCELGDAVSGVRGKDAFFEFVERMMPSNWVNNKHGNSKISIFKSALSGDIAKCKKYKCH